MTEQQTQKDESLLGVSPPKELWRYLTEFRTLAEGIKKERSAQLVYGLARGMDAFFLSALHGELAAPLLVICADGKEASRIYGDLRCWCGSRQVYYFPPSEVIPDPNIFRDNTAAAGRLQVIEQLLRGESPVIVAPVEAMERRLPARELMENCFFSLRRGEERDRDDLLRRLDELGYRREDMVVDTGQVAARGGIVDLFPPGTEFPVRVEFFGDVIDSLRWFGASSQRSGGNVDEVPVGPARETLRCVGDRIGDEACRRLREEADAQIRHLREEGNEGAAQILRERIENQLQELYTDSRPDNFDLFLPYFSSSLDTFLDYLPRDSAVAMWDPQSVKRRIEEREKAYRTRLDRLVGDGAVLPGQMDLMLPPGELDPLPPRRPRIYLTNIIAKMQGVQLEHIAQISGRPSDSFYGQWEVFLSEVKRWCAEGQQVLIATNSEARAVRMRGSLRERGFSGDGITVAQAAISEGFEIPALNLIVLTEQDVFGGDRRVRYQVPKKHRRGVETYEELAEGDYVVHRHHGIGKYLGLSSRRVQGAERDYLVIAYAEGDRLYVPVDSIELVQKYVGEEGRTPRIHRLGSGEWKRVKKRVRESLRDMAEELMQLYSARQSVDGHAYGPDSPWQREFEDSFPFEETPDQLEITREIKEAMEKPQPMDYLLCGDVGFGKTEVALRAAFKSVVEGKQVAILVPTTILAQQHHATARERFADWPVEIEVLSRFRSRAEQEQTVTALRRGDVDMVIGTHRMLQTDVQFRNLGLVIVDEEHRFGVGDKERLKQLKQTVDVLTLTATPIPRTLHMALSGIRDVNVIETPPEDRLPVSTYVAEYDPPMIADAIRREMDRGGQVFYVHNRVYSIGRAARRVEELMPEAQVAVAHGQMPETQLEGVMEDFVREQYDVLVCTTIIESGLDIPNVNTLIVEDADRLGLAQLYQLRGRVGRSDRIAYCYLTYRSAAAVQSLAAERLSALREFTELGSGFRLAKRDLELRGAGNVLGAEQHGHMMAVGFDLYTKMLREEIEALQGERKPPLQRPAIEMNVDAYLPEAYVPSSHQRIALYRRINDIEDSSEVSDVLDELIDRFGDPPPAAVNLIRLAGLVASGAECGVLSLAQRGDGMTLDLAPGEGENVDWDSLASDHGLRCFVSRKRAGGGRVRVHFRLRKAEAADLLSCAGKLLQDLARLKRR